MKCYSCSSANIHKEWPHDSLNRIEYIRQFPQFANESCITTHSFPVVPCEDSVCVKLSILNPLISRRLHHERNVAIVRDCWSRIMKNDVNGNVSSAVFQKNHVQV
ncbi:unnamed protein product [Thelazia callipaeda]|uniref:Uncharacterized protein n=1 Tax=Thelazia callipaeda TaxID=103827 RepID=A0A0N5CXQ5_THECL|nr:unnamed protein product [Thelazia callipaeda]